MTTRRSFFRSLAVAGLAAAARVYPTPELPTVDPFDVPLFQGIPVRDGGTATELWMRECERKINEQIAGMSVEELVQLMATSLSYLPQVSDDGLRAVIAAVPERVAILRELADNAPQKPWFRLKLRGDP